MAVPPHEIAARVRAALAYADVKLTKDKKAQSVGTVPSHRMPRIVSPTDPKGATDEELEEIARACKGVPLAFLKVGFAPFKPISDVEQQLYEHRGRLAAIETAMDSLIAAVTQLANAGSQAAKDSSLQQLEELATSWLADERLRNPPETDSLGGTGQ